jgi:hypothetical protein
MAAYTCMLSYAVRRPLEWSVGKQTCYVASSDTRYVGQLSNM